MTPPSKRQPITFGRYLLLDRINIGGMAEVWRGKEPGPNAAPRLVAIKRILPNIAEDDEFIRMFIDEARICAQLSHPNIAQIIDLGETGSSYFIAMEYIPGKDVRAVFDRCRKIGEVASPAFAAYVIAQLCDGMDHAHRQKDATGADLNIVHRDVSPQNVLIAYEGDVKVIDFGIAKAANKASRTQAGILKGKFGYMSPEQIRGVPLDRRADIFSIGICLYELLTGERLFIGSSDYSVLEKVRKAQVPAPTLANARIPDELESIVLKTLSREPEQRYQHAGDMAAALRAFLSTQPNYGRDDVATFMKRIFAEEVERERQRVEEYLGFKTLAEMHAFPTRTLPTHQPSSPGRSVTNTEAEIPKVPAPSASSKKIDPLTDDNSESNATQLMDRQAGAVAEALLAAPRVPPPEPITLPPRNPPRRRDSKPSLPVVDAPQRTPSWNPEPTTGGSSSAGDRPPTVQARPASHRRNTSPTMRRIRTVVPREWRKFVAVFDRRQWQVLLAVAAVLVLVTVLITRAFSASPTLPYYLVLDVPEQAKGKVGLAINGQSLGIPDSALAQDRVNRWPVVVSMSEPDASIAIDGEGFAPFRERIRLDELHPTVLAAPMERAGGVPFGKVVIVTNVDRANLAVDARVVRAEGTAGRVWEDELPAGKDVLVEVKRKGYLPFKESFSVAANTTSELFIELTPIDYPFSVTSEPRGASVYLDGREVGRTPLNLKIPGDAKELLLKKNCYGDEKVPLKFSTPGSTTTLSRRLVRRSNC